MVACDKTDLPEYTLSYEDNPGIFFVGNGWTNVSKYAENTKCGRIRKMKRSCSALMAIIFVIITLFHAVSCKWTPSYEFKDGALTINGQKGMDDWANDCRKEEGETQTFQIKSEMKELILKGDVLIVPTKAFADCFLLEQVTMSDSINAIEDHAFDNDKSLKYDSYKGRRYDYNYKNYNKDETGEPSPHFINHNRIYFNIKHHSILFKFYYFIFIHK